MKKLSRLAPLGAQRMGIAISRYPAYLSLERHLQELVLRPASKLLLMPARIMVKSGICYGTSTPTRAGLSVSNQYARLIRTWRTFGIRDGTGTRSHWLEGMARPRDIYTGRAYLDSVLAPSGFGLDLFDLSNRGTEQVSMRRLDDSLSDFGIGLSAQPVFVKVDTQGGDRSVIAGAPEALLAAVDLQAEMSLLRIYEGAPAFLGALAEVMELSFDITGMFPVTRDRQHRIIEVDCVLRRVNPADGNLLTT